MSSIIHATAIIDSRVQLPKNLYIGPYCIIESDVILGEDLYLESHSILKKGTVLGSNVRIDSHVVIGGNPQMDPRSFNADYKSGVYIGDHTHIREGVTINRSTKPDSYTFIGKQCFLMASSHVGHDSIIGDYVTMANAVLLAGFVTTGDHVFLGGGSMCHQHVRVGEGSMIGGNATITKDVPPFTLAAERNTLYGLNLIGLKRRGFSIEMIKDIKRCLSAICIDKEINTYSEKAHTLLAARYFTTEKGRQVLEFMSMPSKQGIIRFASLSR